MSPRFFLKSLVLFALVALAASCELDGASKKRAEEARRKAVAAEDARRTNLPMPPAATARSIAEGSVPVGGWTQPDGRRVRLEDLRGQVVILHFWTFG